MTEDHGKTRIFTGKPLSIIASLFERDFHDMVGFGTHAEIEEDFPEHKASIWISSTKSAYKITAEIAPNSALFCETLSRMWMLSGTKSLRGIYRGPLCEQTWAAILRAIVANELVALSDPVTSR